MCRAWIRVAFLLGVLAVLSARAMPTDAAEPPPVSAGYVRLDAGFTPSPAFFVRDGGGTFDLRTAADHCQGFIDPDNPTFQFDYGGGALLLAIFALAEEDVSLAITNPAGETQCADYGFGQNPAIGFENPQAGRYLIWIGSKAAPGQKIRALLGFSEAPQTLDLPQDFTWAMLNASPDPRDPSFYWGDDSDSLWARNGECEDERFTGPGMNSGLEALMGRYTHHDASDCKAAFLAGRVQPR